MAPAADSQRGFFCQRFILAHRGMGQQSFQLVENPGWPRHVVKHSAVKDILRF